VCDGQGSYKDWRALMMMMMNQVKFYLYYLLLDSGIHLIKTPLLLMYFGIEIDTKFIDKYAPKGIRNQGRPQKRLLEE
jgi:hypothetical protein